MNSTGATGKTAPKYLQNCSPGTWNTLQNHWVHIQPFASPVCMPQFSLQEQPQRVDLYTLSAPTGTALFWKQARQISSRKVIFHNYYLIATFSSSPLRLKAVLIQPGSSNSCSQALLTNRLIIKRSSEALCEAFSPKKQLKWRQNSLSSWLLLGHLCL